MTKAADEEIEKLRGVLRMLIETIENTGSVEGEETDIPTADEDWVDMGAVYVAACEALGQTPALDVAGTEMN